MVAVCACKVCALSLLWPHPLAFKWLKGTYLSRLEHTMTFVLPGVDAIDISQSKSVCRIWAVEVERI